MLFRWGVYLAFMSLAFLLLVNKSLAGAISVFSTDFSSGAPAEMLGGVSTVVPVSHPLYLTVGFADNFLQNTTTTTIMLDSTFAVSTEHNDNNS